MENLKAILKKANILPDLKLFTKKEGGGTQTTGPHTVKLVGDKIIKGTDYLTRQEIFLVRIFVEENGEQKKYEFPMKDKKGDIHYLVHRLAEFKEGSEIILEGKNEGGRSFTDVQAVNAIEENNEDEIPIINQDEDIPVIEDSQTSTLGEIVEEESAEEKPKKQKSDEDDVSLEDIPFS